MKAEKIIFNLSKDNLLRYTIYLLMFLYALSVTMISPMMPNIISQFKLKLAEGGLILTFQSIGGLLITMLIVFLADKYKKSRILLLGFSLFVITLYLISVIPIYYMILIVFFFF